ncbi:MAG: cytochrome C [Azoarcus sp.]|jgi:cytochrome c|nr:cytochrome C [Azoarcus sp.]
MNHPFQKALFFMAVAACCAPALAVDVEAAKSLVRRNSCLKCHDVGRDATPFKKIAERYRGDAKAEDKLINHLTSSPEVTYLDGKTKEEHNIAKTVPPKDEAQLRNLVQWVLSN